MDKVLDEIELKAWLEGREPADAVVVAARAALRALPQIEVALEKLNDEDRNFVVLSMFRASITLQSFVVKSDAEITQATLAADAVADSAAQIASTYSATALASATTTAVGFGSVAVSTVRTAAYASKEIWDAVTDDVTALQKGVSPIALIERALWRNELPTELSEHWGKTKEYLASDGEDWGIWINWYEGRLWGVGTSEKLEREVALIDREIWDTDVSVTNAEIRRLIEAHRPTNQQLAEVESAQPFVNAAEQVDVRPNETFDTPEIDDNFLMLPTVQRSVIRTLLSAIREEGNIPAFISDALKEYDNELLKRGVRPYLGILKSQHRIVIDEYRLRLKEGLIVKDGVRGAFLEFDTNHKQIVENFPLDSKREAMYLAAQVNRTPLDPQEIRSLAISFKEAAAEIGARDKATSDFVTVTTSIAEDLELASWSPPSAPEDRATRDPMKPHELTFADRAVIRAMSYSLQVKKTIEAPTAPQTTKEAAHDVGLIVTATSLLTALLHAFR